MIKNDPSLEKCRQLIEASLHWGDPASWTNEDFDNLSERIFDKTAVRLSVSTLKRIWGKVRYESSPTAATLNALARYAGYSGWREFQQLHAGAPDPRLSTSVPSGMGQQPAPEFTRRTAHQASLAHDLHHRLDDSHPHRADLPVRRQVAFRGHLAKAGGVG